MKSGDAVEWPIPIESARLAECWLRDHRPHLTTPDNLFLFPGRDGVDPINDSQPGTAPTRLIARKIGARIHPHLMRHFAAWQHLNAYPGE